MVVFVKFISMFYYTWYITFYLLTTEKKICYSMKAIHLWNIHKNIKNHSKCNFSFLSKTTKWIFGFNNIISKKIKFYFIYLIFILFSFSWTKIFKYPWLFMKNIKTQCNKKKLMKYVFHFSIYWKILKKNWELIKKWLITKILCVFIIIFLKMWILIQKCVIHKPSEKTFFWITQKYLNLEITQNKITQIWIKTKLKQKWQQQNQILSH